MPVITLATIILVTTRMLNTLSPDESKFNPLVLADNSFHVGVGDADECARTTFISFQVWWLPTPELSRAMHRKNFPLLSFDADILDQLA